MIDKICSTSNMQETTFDVDIYLFQKNFPKNLLDS